ncbi:hypothetical protein L596_021901 [Steinernema carpocapsae]|uniref:Uncharacterized protein n=1 Tax=Steinernema carpocapsae TaxID=34508 RepID=A0A4U5MK47_STECR|nr:hypothetical protein L596_021901 [Steinernema carpocapsae]
MRADYEFWGRGKRLRDAFDVSFGRFPFQVTLIAVLRVSNYGAIWMVLPSVILDSTTRRTTSHRWTRRKFRDCVRAQPSFSTASTIAFFLSGDEM